MKDKNLETLSRWGTSGKFERTSVVLKDGLEFTPQCTLNLDENHREIAQAAQLMSAAPELLEAICSVYCLANLQPLLETKYSKFTVNAIMTQMQQAISKARGL